MMSAWYPHSQLAKYTLHCRPLPILLCTVLFQPLLVSIPVKWISWFRVHQQAINVVHNTTDCLCWNIVLVQAAMTDSTTAVDIAVINLSKKGDTQLHVVKASRYLDLNNVLLVCDNGSREALMGIAQEILQTEGRHLHVYVRVVVCHLRTLILYELSMYT